MQRHWANTWVCPYPITSSFPSFITSIIFIITITFLSPSPSPFSYFLHHLHKPHHPHHLSPTRELASNQKILKHPRRAHAAADAHGHQAVADAAPFHFMQQGGGEFRASATEGMTQRDRTTIDIDDRFFQT